MNNITYEEVGGWDEKTLNTNLLKPTVITHVTDLLKNGSGRLSRPQYRDALLREDISYPEKELVSIITDDGGIVGTLLFPIVNDTRLSTAGLSKIIQSIHSLYQVGTAYRPSPRGDWEHRAAKIQENHSQQLQNHDNARVRVVTRFHFYMNSSWLGKTTTDFTFTDGQKLANMVENVLVAFDQQISVCHK